MRKLFSVLLFLLFAQSAFAAITVTQCKSLQANSVTSSSISFDSLPSTTAGTKIKIIPITHTPLDSHGKTFVVTDNQSGNSYALDSGASIIDAAGFQRVDILSGYVVGSSGTFTLTLALNDNSTFVTQWSICEVRSLTSSASLDKIGTASATVATTITVTASGANTQADEIVFGAMFQNGGGTGASTPSGCTQIVDDTTLVGGESCYKIVSASETSALTWTYLIGNSLAVLTTDKAAAAAASTCNGALSMLGVGGC